MRAGDTPLLLLKEPSLAECGTSDLWAYAVTAVEGGRPPSSAMLHFFTHQPVRLHRPSHGRERELEAQVSVLTDSIVTLNREVRELRGRLRHISAVPSGLVFESMDLPDFPEEEVERVAAAVLSYIDEKGTADVFDYAEASDLDFRLVAQAFRRLSSRGTISET